MATFEFSTDFGSLRGKTIVLTGGASGIGAAVVQVAAENGANVVFGDLNESAGTEISRKTGAIFVTTNVVKYNDLLTLFERAFKEFGKIDHAIANAAIYEPKAFFSPGLTLQDLKHEPDTSALDVNIRGVVYFCRLASVYLRQNLVQGEDKCLTLLSSVSGLLAPADTPIYNTTKTAVIGLSKSLAQILLESHGIRVNAICPSLTRTPLATINILPIWESAGLPINEPVDVARIILAVGGDKKSNSKVLWVEGAQACDVHEPTMQLLPQWIGESAMLNLEKASKIMTKGAFLVE